MNLFWLIKTSFLIESRFQLDLDNELRFQVELEN